jgi:c-di-GMP-binding flagellar brake protein YcgR
MRLETPLGVYYPTASFAMNGKQYELQLYDLSIGGVGIRCAPGDAAGLRVGRQLQNVLLKVGPGSEITCDLEIRLVRRFRSFLAGPQVHIGCQFMNLSPQIQGELNRIFERMANTHSESD